MAGGDPIQVRSEIAAVARAIDAVRSGAIPPEEFRRLRVVHGVYPIRGGTDRYLLRVRIPLGRPSPFQLRAIADAADRFASGRSVHLTTRQDVHLYGVCIRDIPDAMAFLAERGLTTREACGDTVRNIVVCPLAGIALDEPFDVAPYAEALGRHLLRNPVGQGLPRKFKIAFEGCEGFDHVGLAVHDVGVRAVRSDAGRPGFRLTLAGGLGAQPRVGIPLEPFTAASDLGDTVTAVLRVFDRMGDRQRRGRARLKFVAVSMGEESFRSAVQEERRACPAMPEGRRLRLPEPIVPHAVSPDGEEPLPEWRGAFSQKQKGFTALPLRVPLGDLSAEQLRRLADIVERADATAGFTPGQGILVSDVPADLCPWMAEKLREAGFFPPGRVAMTRCAGTETCTVGMTRVRSLAALLERELPSLPDPAGSLQRETTVKISGCGNGCGRHLLADIGLQGIARSVAGRLAPHYMLSLGGGAERGGEVRFGTPVGCVPARKVPEAVRRVLDLCRSGAMESEHPGAMFSGLGAEHVAGALADLLDPPKESLSEEDFQDIGDPDPVPFPPDRSGSRAP